MRWILLLLSAASGATAQGGVRVTGRVTMLEKGGKPSPDLAAAVISLEGAFWPGLWNRVTSARTSKKMITQRAKLR